MASIATGANVANRDLHYIGVSGDGDSLSIGLGQFGHAIRRNVNMTYIIENNGVYGLTKGQFSASADAGSRAKKGETNTLPAIDPASLAISLGCSFVARGFSGDKKHLVPLIKAAVRHRGFALLDVLSPCVTFNDHEGSTKSYAYTREHQYATVYADFIDPRQEIEQTLEPGQHKSIVLHDGSRIRLHRVDEQYDPTDRAGAFSFIESHRAKGQVVTGLLYINKDLPDLHETSATGTQALAGLDYEKLNPGAEALAKVQARWK